MNGLFEHLSAFDDNDQIVARKAAAVAHKRFEDQVGSFLRAASDADDYQARVALVSDDVAQLVDDVANEFGANAEHLKASVFAGITAAGGFCDNCRKWRSGPRAGCTCDGDEGGSESESSEPEPDSDSDSEKEASTKTSIELATEPIMTQQPLPDEPGEGVTDINGELAEAPSAVGEGEQVTSAMLRARHLMAARKQADGATPETGDSGEKREKVEQPEGPSPKIDKRTWKPNALNDSGNLKPIDTDGGPYKTVDQDVTDKPDWNADFLAQTDTVTDSEDLPSNSGDAGFDTDRNIEQPSEAADQWTGTEGLADPVTSSRKAATDSEKNPVREALEEQFTNPEDAIMEWEKR